MTDLDKDSPFHYFQRAGATPHQLRMLQAALRASPELNRLTTAAIEAKELTRIGLLGEKAADNGRYDPLFREIRFNPELLSADIRPGNVDRVVDVMAHEISHASRRQQQWQISNALDHRAFETAKSNGPRDWTQFVREAIAYGRYEEARAELDGINVLADRIRHEQGGPVAEAELARRLHLTSACVERGPDKQYHFKPGIQFDPENQSVAPTKENLKAIARCHFDENPFYPHYYASTAISRIAAQESVLLESGLIRPIADNQIDLAGLGLDRAALTKHLLSKESGGPFQFVDTSAGQRHWVQMGVGGKSDAPEPRSHVAAHLLSEEDRGLFAGLRERLRVTAQWDAGQVDNIAAALLLQVRRDPVVQRVDDIIVGPRLADGRVNVFALYKPFGDATPIFSTHVEAGQAISTSAQDSLLQLRAASQPLDLAPGRALAQPQELPGPLVRGR